MCCTSYCLSEKKPAVHLAGCLIIMENSTGCLLKLFVQFLRKVVLICMHFGVNNIFARPWTLKLFWNVSLFQRNSWLSGLPTTFMFVGEDLNNTLQETGLAHWDPTVLFWDSPPSSCCSCILPPVISHLVSQQNVRRLTKQLHIGFHCIVPLLSLGDWEKISYSWHGGMGNLGNMTQLLRRFGKERWWGKQKAPSSVLVCDVSHHAERQVSIASEKPENPVCLGGKYN